MERSQPAFRILSHPGACGPTGVADKGGIIEMITSIILLALAFTSSAADRPLFALDGWHNNESSNPTHYQWALSSCDMGSFCGLGSRVYNIGNDTVTVRQALSADVL